VLGLAASAILLIFNAETTRIVPLYAVGVFTAFTLSQTAIVVHWRNHQEAAWRRSLLINAFGACATFLVAVIVAVTKFTHGAWISIALILLLVVALSRVRAHYENEARKLGHGLEGAALAIDRYLETTKDVAQPVVIPVDEINRVVLRALAYSRSISSNTVAAHVAIDPDRAEALRRRWLELVPDVPFVVVDSPYRSLVEPFEAYFKALHRERPDQMITVVLPEVVTRWPWQRFLDNQLSLRLKRALAGQPNIVLVEVPYHFSE
jgi:hypothetical protein